MQSETNTPEQWREYYSCPQKFGKLFGDYSSLRDKALSNGLTSSEKNRYRVCAELIDGKLQ